MEWCGTYKLKEDKTYEPCDSLTFFEQMKEMRKNNEKHVAKDEINGHIVSTVWLGMDHKFNDEGPPLLFETMVFDKNSLGEIYFNRYSTNPQAEEGHKKAIQWVKDGCKEE